MKKIMTLALNDVKNIKRDSMLLPIIIAPIMLTLLARFGLPPIRNMVFEKLSFDIYPYYDFIALLFLMVIPMMVSIIEGFILLDDKDEEMLSYFAITPLTKSGYLKYRLISALVICFILTNLFLLFSNLVKYSFLKFMLLSLLASLEGAIGAIILATFASNKVEGLALSKALSLLILPAAIAYFVKSKLHWLGAFIPHFWMEKSFMAALYGSNFMLFMIIGLICHILFLYYLVRSFVHKY